MAVDFAGAVKKLPPDGQKRVQAWMSTQMFIARELGLSSQAWLAYVEWAFAHPLDFSFVGEGANASALEASLFVTAAEQSARRAAGVDKPAALPQKPAGTARSAGLNNINTLGNLVPRKKK